MKQEIDISKGVDPVRGVYDIKEDLFRFKVDGRIVTFDTRRMPFTTTYAMFDGQLAQCADKALILKHEQK